MRNFSPRRGREFSRGKTLDPCEWVVERNSPVGRHSPGADLHCQPPIHKGFGVNLIF